MSDRYILNDKGEPVAESDLLKWSKWFEDTEAMHQKMVEMVRETL